MKLTTLLLAATATIALVACGSESSDHGSAAVGGSNRLFGAIMTTTKDGSKVNGNIYADCRDVYLNGGPKGGGPALPPGDYYFMVTSPSGGPPSMLLSSDNLSNRIVTVGTNGEITAYQGTHDKGIDVNDGSVTVQLWPFMQTPNPGNEYKAWITPVGKLDVTAKDNVFGFVHDWSKTDNFKCTPPPPPPPPPGDAGPPADSGTPDSGPPADSGTRDTGTPDTTPPPPPPCTGEDCVP